MSLGPMSQLNTLRTMLRSAFDRNLLRRADGWTDPIATAKMIAHVRQQHDRPGVPPDSATIASAVADFRRTGELNGWRELKRVCFGASAPDEEGWCLLADKALRETLMAHARDQENARKRERCFQALLFAYWNFSRPSDDQKAEDGWRALRKWLDDRLPSIAQDSDRTPEWLATLKVHQNLLQDDPCLKYGINLLAGATSEFNSVIKCLGIPSDSWVPDEAIIAQMRAGAALDHDKFTAILPKLLKLVTGKAAVVSFESLQIRCVALLVSRYAKIPGQPEHMALRDVAVGVIGNPWLRRLAWDAAVVDDRGRPDNGARVMVDGWLKRRLIKDFFELLSQDGGVGDSRRLHYWLRFEPFITNMWFALGKTTRDNQGEKFKEFRRRATGRLINLKETMAKNNAFIMRMGDYIAIEFGEYGHALYLYKWGRLPPALLETLELIEEVQADVPIQQFRVLDRAILKENHADKASSMFSWEQKFDRALCAIIGNKPKERAAFIPDLEDLLTYYKFEAEDRRSQGGAFWILTDDSKSAFSSKIRGLGFSYRAGKGWYREDEVF